MEVGWRGVGWTGGVDGQPGCLGEHGDPGGPDSAAPVIVQPHTTHHAPRATTPSSDAVGRVLGQSRLALWNSPPTGAVSASRL
ncbi:hypothetical protein BL253_10690 [Pseudofrankia asymbiotica]|uniref:Uncharacterized protein n=1 Tax=Pseudofrankia asymbiotica TaxID=1834516 RepID=A0A1V2IDG0_9ACTN|nr:hypothetical protein BL253_10690 [Pseudofrankia asymbiotica]